MNEKRAMAKDTMHKPAANDLAVNTPFRIPHVAWLVALLVAGGALLTWWTVARADRELRADLLQQVRLLGQAVNAESVKALTGTPADADNPDYLRLKAQLAATRSATPTSRFLYLMGRKASGEIFFLVDSEAVESEDYSPPGQVYGEASETNRQVFATRTAAVEGPATDRWGTWVTALVPIHDPQTALVDLATPDEAKMMVQKAVGFYRKNGRQRLLQEVNKPQGEFSQGDLHAFVYDPSMTMLAHPAKPELVGQTLLDEKDWAGGKYFQREIREVAQVKGSGWVDYEDENPANQQREPKTIYVERADDLIICAGSYKGTGGIVAVLGMDVDARNWKRLLVRAALPPVLLTLALVAIALTGSALLARRARSAEASPLWRRHLEPALAVAAGLALTLFVARTMHEHQTLDRRETFAQLAASRTEAIAETLRDLRDTELEGLAHFQENSAVVTREEFRQFTAYLTKNPAVQAWEWAPAVPAADKARFEEEARAAGFTDFEVWQKDAAGQRQPAAGREVYYPVLQVAPLAGNDQAVGYDLGSEPLRRAALEEAMASGLPTGTEPITLVQETGSQQGMLICRPVFARDDPKRLRGFAVAVLRMEALLQKRPALDASVLMGLSLLRQDAAPELLATSWDAASPPTEELSALRPVFSFGKVFGVSAHAGPEFMHLHQVWAGWLATLTGLALTTALAVVIRMTINYLDYQKAAQFRILQQEKMASVGQLAAGVAHEINNPTGYLMSNMGSLRKYAEKLTEYLRIQEEAMTEAPPDRREAVKRKRKELKVDLVVDDLGKLIDESREGAERIKKIVQDLKSFSRADESEPQLADINAGIESTLNIVWNELKYKATVSKEYGEIPPIKCHPGQLSQVFMNILVNAAHAIEKQGEIRIKTWAEGGSVKISIADNGCGIARDKINRVFEPFFTTKEVGKGTGLGLSISYDIVKRHGGEITIDSEEGQGTTFTIQLPMGAGIGGETSR